MLVFCEDCGESNDIDVVTVRTAGNQYRCLSCNFLNILLVKEVAPAVIKKKRKFNLSQAPYDKVFQKIAEQKDILGAYIYNSAKGIIAADVVMDLSDPSMLKVGQALTVCRNMSKKILQNTTETYLVLMDQIVVSRGINNNTLLIFLCKDYPLEPHIEKIINESVGAIKIYELGWNHCH